MEVITNNNESRNGDADRSEKGVKSWGSFRNILFFCICNEIPFSCTFEVATCYA